MAELRVDILTLFPDTVNAMLHESILGRAARKGILDLRCTQIRDYTENRQCQVDDYPYGGGFGCVMMAQPLKSCLDAVLSEAETRRRVIYLSPQGRPFTQETARRLQRDYDHLVLVCGDEQESEAWIEDCAVAAFALHLEAHDLGLASCWVQLRGREYNEQKSAPAYVRELLHLPEQMQPLALVAMGHPGDSKKPHDPSELRFDQVSREQFGTPWRTGTP